MKNKRRISFIEKPEETYLVKDIEELNEIITQCRNQHRPLANLDLSNIELKNIDLSKMTIENVIFNTFDVTVSENKLIYNVCFKGSRLSKVSFAQCNLVRCNFDKLEPVKKEYEKLSHCLGINVEQNLETHIEETDFFLCQFELCRFRETYIKIADFRYSQFLNCSLGGSQIELGDFYMAAFKGTTNFTNCIWTHCSITNATFENHCLRMNSIKKLAQESYKNYSEIIIKYETWHKQNPCADFSCLNKAEDKNCIVKSKSYISREASEVYALLSGLYAGKGLFKDSNIAYELAKKNEAWSQYYTLKDELIILTSKLLPNKKKRHDTQSPNEMPRSRISRILKSLACIISFFPCWLLGFGYKLKNVVVFFITLVLVFGYIFHVKNDECNVWYDEVGYSLNNAMGPLDEFIEAVGCWLSSVQTTTGLLLIGFAGFIIANRIRNNY